MKDSSSRLVFGVIAVCLLVLVACILFGPFRKAEREQEKPSEVARPVVKDSGEGAPREGAPVPIPPLSPEEKPAPPKPEEVKEFDISGIVLDKVGNPLEEATVKCAFYSLENFSTETGRGIEESKPVEYRTKADGKFGFAYQEGKRYVLNVEKEDYIPEYRNMATPQKDMVITLTLGGAIEGKVIDAVTSEPLDQFRIVTSEDIGGGALLGIFSKKEEDIHLPSDGKEFSNPEGTFRLAGLQEGKYRLVSTAKGYAQSYSPEVEVKLEKTTSGVVIKQQPAGKISGHVVDTIGKPIEGATVAQKNPLHSTVFGELGLPQRKILASTNAKGEFEIGGLPAGKFTLQARHPDYCPAEQEVKVSKGEATEGVEFQLVQGGRISGVVLAKTDLQPIPGASVRATTGSTFLIPAMGGAEAKTDNSGLFDLIKLEPGTYSLTASASDFAEKTIEDLKLAQNEAVANLIIELSQGGSLVGKVDDYSGKPLPNIIVFAAGPGGQKVGQTDKDGNYAIKNLKEGTYVAGAAEVSGVGAMGASRSDSHFVVIENDKETRLDIVVGGALRVYGKVTRKGEPEAGVIVAIETSPKTVMATKSTTSANDNTEEDGTYEIKSVKPGAYSLAVMKVVAMMPTRLFETDIELADKDLEKNVELPEGEISGKVVDAENRDPIEGAKVTLEQRRAKDVREAAILKIGLFIGGGENTDSEGKYSFPIVADGEYFVVASKEGYAPQGLSAEVRNSRGPSNLDFSLSRGVILSGQVSGSDPSRPIREVFLSAIDSEGRPVYSKRISLSDAGEYQASGLAPGDYIVSVDARGYASAKKKVRVSSGADNRADFALTAGGTIVIRAVDERGRPVTGAQTELLDEQANFFLGFFPDLKELMNIGFEAISRGDGVDISRNIPDGKYRVKVSAMGYEDEFVNVAVRGGEQTDQTVTLREAK